jgi:RNA polymerase sigma-70 factor, ECF subfamily
MNEQERHNLFCELISRHHSQLYAYIFVMVRNREDASDLFQSVCLVLWRKFESFQPNSSFFSWARQTAKLVVRNFLRHKKRSSRYVSEELLDTLAETVAESRDQGADLYLAALRRCKQKLITTDEELLELRYVEDLGSREIADRLHRPQPSVCHSLTRIRQWLLECIQLELLRQEYSQGIRGRKTHG